MGQDQRSRPDASEPRQQQQVRFAEARDGARIAYAVAGDGPPLVNAPHWLSHLEHDWRSPLWQPWLEGMAHPTAPYVEVAPRGGYRAPGQVRRR